MASDHHRFGIQDVIAVAVLTGTATALLWSKLETLGVRLSPALRQLFIEWWPLLLILVGIILLFSHYRSAMTSHSSGRQPGGASLHSSVSRGTHEY